MRLKFDTTIDDHVDAYERASARSGAARSWRRQGAAVTALLSGLITGIIGFVVIGRSITAGLIGGAIVAIASGAISWNMHRNTIRQRMHRYFREKFGDRDSLPFEVELTESGIRTRQPGTQIIFEWANVEDVVENEDDIEFVMRDGGGLIVRKRAFTTTDEQQQFMEVTRSHLNASRTSSNWLHSG
jgi:hypothetical protein